MFEFGQTVDLKYTTRLWENYFKWTTELPQKLDNLALLFWEQIKKDNLDLILIFLLNGPDRQ
jgi:hypothetical protein